MTTRLLLRLYPSWWRARYGEEFLALLDDYGSGFGCAVDIVRSAADARMSGDHDASLSSRQRSALCSSIYTVAVLVPIAAVLLRVPDDAGMVAAASRHPLVGFSLVVVFLGVMGIAVFALAGTIIFGGLALREARRTRRREFVLPLAAVAAGVLILIGAEALLGISYAALTQAQRQSAAAAAATEVALIAWAALCVLGLGMCAGGLRRAVRHTQFSTEDGRSAAGLAWGVVCSAAAVLGGAIVWGVAMLIEARMAFASLGTAAWLAIVAVGVLALAPSVIALGRCPRATEPWTRQGET
jgi:hypothetical protein